MIDESWSKSHNLAQVGSMKLVLENNCLTSNRYRNVGILHQQWSLTGHTNLITLML